MLSHAFKDGLLLHGKQKDHLVEEIGDAEVNHIHTIHLTDSALAFSLPVAFVPFHVCRVCFAGPDLISFPLPIVGRGGGILGRKFQRV